MPRARGPARGTRCAHFVRSAQTPAASMRWMRASTRAGHGHCASRRLRCAPPAARRRRPCGGERWTSSRRSTGISSADGRIRPPGDDVWPRLAPCKRTSVSPQAPCAVRAAVRRSWRPPPAAPAGCSALSRKFSNKAPVRHRRGGLRPCSVAGEAHRAPPDRPPGRRRRGKELASARGQEADDAVWRARQDQRVLGLARALQVGRRARPTQGPARQLSGRVGAATPWGGARHSALL